jgi:hypothetical protein
MGSILLTIGGVVQLLVLALHVTMFFGIASAAALPADVKPTLHIFNAAVATLVAFIAYVSLFRKRELLTTGLGRAVCLFVGFFYLQRAVVEVVVRKLDPIFFPILCAVAALYAVAAFAPTRSPAPAGKPVAP